MKRHSLSRSHGLAALVLQGQVLVADSGPGAALHQVLAVVQEDDHRLRPHVVQDRLDQGSTGVLADPGASFRTRSVRTAVRAQYVKLTGVLLPQTPPYETHGRLLGEKNDADAWTFTYQKFSGKVGASDIPEVVLEQIDTFTLDWIKGNKTSKKFHAPSSPWYDRTNAEVWFRTAEAAEKAGFVNAEAKADEKADA